MKIIFFSKFYPRKLRKQYLSLSKSGLAAAADAHQYALAQGLSKVCRNFEIINLPALYPYPFRYKRLYEKKVIVEENELRIQNVGFCNLAFFQNYSRLKNATSQLEKSVESETDQVWIVIYSTNSAFLESAVRIKEKYRNVKLCLIVPDLPEDMCRKSLLGKIPDFLNNLGFSSFEAYCKKMDLFILLSEQMSERIAGCENKYMVSEGIYDETGIDRNTIKEVDAKPFVVLYSGMLYHKFGIMNLVEAIHKLKDSDIQLDLYGIGDAVEDIISMAASDTRIQYKGVVDRDVVLQKQSEASLLVNPRVPDNNPFTRYSFPSKTLEYLASGTPTLLYELDGIPSEYYSYCFHLDKQHTDVDSLCAEIARIKAMSSGERHDLAIRARNFIINNKNALVMSQKIYEFILEHSLPLNH